jgi:hypothetical protein
MKIVEFATIAGTLADFCGDAFPVLRIAVTISGRIGKPSSPRGPVFASASKPRMYGAGEGGQPMIRAAIALAALALVLAAMTGVSQAGAHKNGVELFAPFSCDTIVRSGWDKMPDVADYIKSLPGSEKLGFGSECHLGSLVFAQCFLEPRWSVKRAIDELIRKARDGKKLPDTPVCGA